MKKELFLGGEEDMHFGEVLPTTEALWRETEERAIAIVNSKMPANHDRLLAMFSRLHTPLFIESHLTSDANVNTTWLDRL